MSEELKELEVGDPVEIIGYGTRICVKIKDWESHYRNHILPTKKPSNIIEEDKDNYIYDGNPNMVGQTGFIGIKSTSQNIVQYSLRGVEGKLAWYCREQLKKI